MKRFFVNKNSINNDKLTLEGEEFFHLKNVLRMSVGDELICFCGDQFDYLCEIENITKTNAILLIKAKTQNQCNPTSRIVVYQGLPKGDKFDFIVQKLSELGASEIIPFESDFTIAKPSLTKFDRLNKVAIEACKQCGRSVPLKVHECISFKQVCEEIKTYPLSVVFYEKENSLHISKLNFEPKILAIIVGSEGGFSEKEIEMLINSGAKSVGLGKRILRCETAGLAVCAYIMFSKEE